MKREEIANYYHEYLEGILYPFIRMYSEVRWFKVNELILEPGKTRLSWKEKVTDPYIQKHSSDIEGLARDIEKRGTYAPIFIASDNTVMMGVHRVEALKAINSDREFLCLVLPDKCFDQSRTDKKKYEWKNSPYLDYDYLVSIPNKFEIPADARKDEYLLVRLNKKKISNSSGLYTRVVIDTYSDLIDALKIIPHWIKNFIYEDGTIEPPEVLNDKEVFEEWITEDYTVNI